MSHANTSNVDKIFKFANISKAHRSDGIFGKLIKTSADVADCHLAKIIKNFYLRTSENDKVEIKRQFSKKKKKKNHSTKIKYYWPVTFSKKYKNKFCIKISNTFLAESTFAYCKSYGLNH